MARTRTGRSVRRAAAHRDDRSCRCSRPLAVARSPRHDRAGRSVSGEMRRLAPTLLAAALAAAYVIASPPSLDLAAHVLRARLFSAEGFGIWNNWWYGGHHVVLYS